MTDPTTADSNPGPAAAPPVVDTPELRDRLDCPLCGYSLRGLAAAAQAEARCPECGYPFSWEQLLRARQHRHPYLFEHHPGVGGFFRTLMAGLRPRRFWSSLNASHQVRPARLMIYALIVSLLTAPSVPLGHVLGIAAVQMRRAVSSGYFMSRVLNLAFWQSAVDNARAEGDLLLFLVLACVAWPWVTLAALMVFQVSMRRARVRTAHVVRCVVYSGDVLVWAGLGLLGGGALGVLSTYRYFGGARPIIGCVLPAALFAAYRLGVAYRRYLRFEHAWSTAITSQIIFVLAFTTVLAVFYQGFFRLFW
jgi:hypothetical protein